MTGRLRIGAVALLALASACWFPAAIAGQGRGTGDAAALQVMADIVLIESRCGTLNVDYAKLFAYAEAHGIRPVEIMPTGERRGAFEDATRRRVAETSPARLCSDLAAERETIIPGVFTAR